MKNVMVDIETLGNSDKANLPIISIAAVKFNGSGETSPDVFYRVIKLSSALEQDVVEASTLKWWLGKDKREEFFNIIFDENAVDLETALNDLADYLPRGKDIQYWAQGINFDQVILEAKAKRFGISLPGQYYQWMDSRTYIKTNLKLLGLDLDKKADKELFSKLIARDGVHHNALDDVFHQIKCVCYVGNTLKDNLNPISLK